MNKTKNARYIETENNILSAMMSLLDEKPYKKITVNDICAKCKINRSSFYLHFEDVPSLMLKLQKNIFSEITNTYAEKNVNTDSEIFSSDNIIIILSHISRNRNFYRAWLNENLSLSMDNMTESLFENVIRKHLISLGFESGNDKDERYMRYHFDFFLAGFIQIIKDWLDFDCPETPQELAAIISKHITTS